MKTMPWRGRVGAAWVRPWMALWAASLLSACGGGGAGAPPLPSSIAIETAASAQPGVAATFSISTALPEEVTVRWSFGDGSSATDRRARHTYAAAGDFRVSATVSDAAGQSVVATTIVPVRRLAMAQGLTCTTPGLAGNASWCRKPLRLGPPSSATNPLAFAHTSELSAVAWSKLGVWVTRDGGESWQANSTPSGNVLAAAFTAIDRGWILLRTDPSVAPALYETSDGAKTWRPLPGWSLTSVAGYRLEAQGEVLAVTPFSFGGGGFRRDDAVHPWSQGPVTGPAWISADGGRSWRSHPMAQTLSHLRVTSAGTSFSECSTRLRDDKPVADLCVWDARLQPLPPLRLEGRSVSLGQRDTELWAIPAAMFQSPPSGVVRSVARSVDGGLNWQTVPVPATNATYWSGGEIKPLGGGQAWFLDFDFNNELLWRLAANGAVWTLPSHPAGAFDLSQRMLALNDNTLLSWRFEGPAWISTDRGATWGRSADGPSLTNPVDGTPLRGHRSGNGALWLEASQGALRASLDGGDRWRHLTPTRGVGIDAVFEDAWLSASGQTVRLIARDGAVLYSDDGGSSWRVGQSSWYTPTLADLRDGQPPASLHFVSADTAWALVGSGPLMQSADGGRSWSPRGSFLPDFRAPVLRALHAGTGTEMFVLLDASVSGTDATPVSEVWRSSDGGGSWALRGRLGAPAAGMASHSLHAADANTLLAGDRRGRVWRSGDGGQRWSEVLAFGAEAGSAHSVVVQFADATRAWAAGSAGQLHRSDDGGLTWRRMNTTITDTIVRLRFAGPEHGWLITRGGALWATRDGGLTWLLQQTGAPAALRSVVALDAYTAFVIGDQGFVGLTVQ